MNKAEIDRGISIFLLWPLHEAVCAGIEIYVYIHQCPYTHIHYEKESTDKAKQKGKKKYLGKNWKKPCTVIA